MCKIRQNPYGSISFFGINILIEMQLPLEFLFILVINFMLLLPSENTASIGLHKIPLSTEAICTAVSSC